MPVLVPPDTRLRRDLWRYLRADALPPTRIVVALLHRGLAGATQAVEHFSDGRVIPGTTADRHRAEGDGAGRREPDCGEHVGRVECDAPPALRIFLAAINTPVPLSECLRM